MINCISVAALVFLDGSSDEEHFEISSSTNFVPGKEISIEVGYNNQNQLVFKGLVTKQNLRVDNSIGSTLTVECRDAAVKMTVGRKNACYTHVKDSDVMTSLIGNYGGLSASVTTTSETLPQLVQSDCSDWDFMLSRAEINGMVVSTINGTVSVFKPETSANSVLTITYGDNLYSLNADLNAVTQLESVTKITGEARVQGNSLVEPSVYITLAGLGTRFDGNHFVSGVTHTISDGNWFTDVKLGLSPDWFVQKNRSLVVA